jgi:transposase-like protein
MMTKKLTCSDQLFKGRHFEREIIILCVRWYLRFKLSFRVGVDGPTASNVPL